MSKTILIIAAVTFLIVLSSPYLFSATVRDFNQLGSMRFGFPLPVLEQSVALTPPDAEFPLSLTLQNPWEHPTSILWGSMFRSLVVTYVFLLAIWQLAKLTLEKAKK